MSLENFKNVLSKITTFKTLERFEQLSEVELSTYEAYAALPTSTKKKIDLKHSKELRIALLETKLGAKQFRDSIYNITPDGRILNTKTGKFIRVHNMKVRPYSRTTLIINGKPTSFLVHRLVAEVHIPNPLNLPHVDHINSDETRNNNISNLRWTSIQDNHLYKINQGRQSSKLRAAEVKIIKSLLAAKTKIAEIAKTFNMSTNAISAIRTNKTWKHVTL
jgi:hypothetical protein